MAHAQKPDFVFRARRTSQFKSARGYHFSRLLAAEVCASAVVLLDTPCSEVGTGYPLHSPVSPSLPITCVTMCHQPGRQFSRLLAAELCASEVVMLDTPCSEVGTGFPLHLPVSPSLPLPCITLCHQPASVQSTTGSRVVRIRGSNAGYTMFRCRYWLPTPFASFSFTSPPVRHYVPSHFNWSLPCRRSLCFSAPCKVFLYRKSKAHVSNLSVSKKPVN